MTTLVNELGDYRKALDYATTRESIGAIYEQMVGYNIAEDCNDSFEDLRDLAFDYIREVCYANGIHVSEVGLG